MTNSRVPQPQAPADPYGYLLVHFIENPNGYTERIYLDLSDGDNPERWNPLNGGQPILTSPLGTTGVRDPYLTRNPETGRVYIIATDLRVFVDGHGSDSNSPWYEFSHHGSTNLIIWYSDDLVHWSEPHELDVSRKPDGSHIELGMAWAPEALWVPDYYPEGHEGGRGAFVLYWSSKTFADDDPDHTADAYDRVLWGATSDFTDATFEYGGIFIDRNRPTIDTTMLQRALPDGTIRTYRATKANDVSKPGVGIWLDATSAERWWEPSTEWTVVQEGIGADWVPNHDPAGVEGPALFASHSDDRAFLYVDVIPSIGYKPMVTSDPERGFDYLRADDFYMAPHTKHGGVMSLSHAEYDRLKAADGTIG